MQFPLKPILEVYNTTFTGTVPISMPSLPSGALVALLQVETAAVRVQFNGTLGVVAGAGGGILLPINDINMPWYRIEGWDLLNRARLVANTGTPAINVVYLGPGQP